MFWSWRITEIKMDIFRWGASTWETKPDRLFHLNTCVFRATVSISPALASHNFIFSCHLSFSVQKLTSSDVFGNPSVCSAGLRRAPPTDSTLNRWGQPPKTASAKRQRTTALNTRTRPRPTWWVLRRSDQIAVNAEWGGSFSECCSWCFSHGAFKPLTLFTSLQYHILFNSAVYCKFQILMENNRNN